MRAAILGIATVLSASVIAERAAAGGTAVVPVSAAEGQLTGLPRLETGRFGSAGSTVAGVGDVNGDGASEIAAAAPSDDRPGRRDAGVVRVVFGGSPLGRIDLDSAATPGFVVIGPRQGARRPPPVWQPDGPPEGAMAGSAIAGAGDVNGDGLGDLLIAAPFTGHRGRAFSGSVYVVFGKRSPEPVDLERLGAAGFRIDGPRRDAAAGHAVAGVGDVNGDGRPDVVVSAGRTQRATAYVVFGKADTAAVDLHRLGRRGFAIRGDGQWLLDAGDAVSAAGDFNGDGRADIALGAPQSGTVRRDGAGFTFVVFGGPHRGVLRLGALGRRGVRIMGEHEFSNLGESLASLGDVNGDGRGDLLIGASQVSSSQRPYAGAAYVVFGRAAGSVDLRRPGDAAYRIAGPPAGEDQARAGLAVAAIPDVNGDGRTDSLIGAPGAGRRCSAEEGAAYVVFSQPSPVPLVLDDLGAAGYAISGVRPEDFAGTGVASAGDWNGDGRGDALVLRTDFGSGLKRPPRLDLVLGRMPPALPVAPTPAQLPSVAIPNPSLTRFLSRSGIDARITVNEAGIGDLVTVELRTTAFGDDLPLAGTAFRVSAPGTTTVQLKAFALGRRAIGDRTRVPVRVLVSQCTTSGQELSGGGDFVLARD